MKGLLALKARRKLDALLVVTEVNRYYFTGLLASNGALLVADGPAFYTDFRYLIMARACISFMPVRNIWRAADEQSALAKMGKGWRRVGYEGTIDARRLEALRKALPQVEWVDVSGALAEMRSVKSPAEQRALRRAVRANDVAFSRVRELVCAGMREWDVRNIIRREMDTIGQGEAFDTIVCAGKNSAECHHHPDETVIRDNRPVLIDMGVKLDYYCSDMTRSFCMGAPSPFYREIYRVVLEANRKAIRAIRPGRACADIDAIARRHIEKAGYAKYFDHSLGHSLGLEVHEAPSFALTCKTILKPGMALTVEPGIYLPGRFGIRIEDVILVTSNGCEVLSATPAEA
ncbi:MAG: Xaa-Pro peptidase family protein [Kiritimatiellaeota bacterium]|nr:Xaa-Pro peptidase family protein [Kiritimatiellota bacterium]